MATEISRDVDAHIVNLLTKLAALRDAPKERQEGRRLTMSNEFRSLELWRAVAVECLATFMFCLVSLGAGVGVIVHGSGLLVLATCLGTGCSIAAIWIIFGHISGGHVNPAVSIAFAFARKISPFRACLYIAAQCGGGIAGAAMLYGVTGVYTMSSSTGRLSGSIEKLLLEKTLSVFIVLAHLNCDSSKNLMGSITSRPAAVLAATYTAATLVASPYMNPARALGPAFVMNRWDSHWVYWVGPIAGGIVASLIHEYALTPKRPRNSVDLDDGDNSSMRSEDDPYDDLDKATGPKFPGGYATYRPVTGASSIYSPPPSAIERVESIYGGTKSLYCKSPPLTRANLNRSQSVYAKSTSGPREGLVIPKPGPLAPAQSLYHMRIGPTTLPLPSREQGASSVSSSQPGSHSQAQNHNSTNQNMQNQLQACTQSIYGIRGISTSVSTRESGIYGVTSSSVYGRTPLPPSSSTQNSQNSSQNGQREQREQRDQREPPLGGPNQGQANGPEGAAGPRRPESMYGHISRRSDDSAYGSYQGSNRGNYGKIPGPPPPAGWSQTMQMEQSRPSPVAGPLQQNHNQNYPRNSPNPQY
ncbi:neurogenic protein big brain [Diachasmimorpha longicaudata]|uniref:neurogenic protein big brain n=1 Tax=Diachasmimorpha longicaudata TaxID=58733 RepID=UPI0030B8B7EF